MWSWSSDGHDSIVKCQWWCCTLHVFVQGMAEGDQPTWLSQLHMQQAGLAARHRSIPRSYKLQFTRLQNSSMRKCHITGT